MANKTPGPACDKCGRWLAEVWIRRKEWGGADNRVQHLCREHANDYLVSNRGELF